MTKYKVLYRDYDNTVKESSSVRAQDEQGVQITISDSVTRFIPWSSVFYMDIEEIDEAPPVVPPAKRGRPKKAV